MNQKRVKFRFVKEDMGIYKKCFPMLAFTIFRNVVSVITAIDVALIIVTILLDKSDQVYYYGGGFLFSVMATIVVIYTLTAIVYILILAKIKRPYPSLSGIVEEARNK